MAKWFRNHGLSSLFAALFIAAFFAQTVTGHFSYNSQLSVHGMPRIGYLAYLSTGNFLDGMFTNWQAALLQLGCLILFGRRFREKGAPHSLRRNPKTHPDREGQNFPWIYRNSLSLAFALLFALAFIAHLFFGARKYNENLRMIHQPPISLVQFGLGSAFWFANAQTWEAEFAAIAIYVVLSIFLRQQGSPESKPVASSNSATGITNE
jgi:hypothetical protein